MAGPADNHAPDGANRSPRPYDVLLLDFGGVCLLNPVELHHHLEQVLALPDRTFQWLGPVDPATDELWQRMVAGDGLTERQYWAERAAEVGRTVGRSLDTRAYMELVYHPPRPELIRPGATATTVAVARAAGFGVSVLTNDLSAFHGPDWQHGIEFFQLIDHLVDCSHTGVLKPDPRAFALACDTVGVAADRMLFVDDLPLNVEGAIDAGLGGVWFDVSKPEASWAEVQRLLQLD